MTWYIIDLMTCMRWAWQVSIKLTLAITIESKSTTFLSVLGGKNWDVLVIMEEINVNVTQMLGSKLIETISYAIEFRALTES